MRADRQLRPSPDNPEHFVARTRHVLEWARRNPPSPTTRFASVGGVEHHHVAAITSEVLGLLEAESAPFDSKVRDRALECGEPRAMPSARVVLIEAHEGGLTVPVFMTPESNALRYLEVSVDLPGAPIVVVIDGYNGLAVRLSASARTAVAAVHVHTYYPSVVLGVDPSLVTRQYAPRARRACVYTSINSVNGAAVVEKLGLDAKQALRYRTRGAGGYHLAIGPPQPTRRDTPRLGSFLDPEMPAPHSYGILVLQHLGYITPGKYADGSLSAQIQYVLKPFRLPEGLSGSHSVDFYVRDAGPVPSGELQHSAIRVRDR